MPFKRFNELNDQVDEFDVEYNPKDNSFEKLIDFIQEYNDKRVNVKYTGNVDIKTARTFGKIGGNVYFKLSGQDVRSIDELKECGCRYFFGNDVPAYNLTSLASFVRMGVSDVYIKDDLWYDLTRTASYCHDNHIALRVVANRVPSTALGKGDCAEDMFLRPSDIALIDGLVDTLEFDCWDKGVYDFAKADVLYRAFFDKGEWNGDLREINCDLKLAVPNTALFPQFTASKLVCGLVCRKGGKCAKCGQFLEVAGQLSKKKVRVKL